MLQAGKPHGMTDQCDGWHLAKPLREKPKGKEALRGRKLSHLIRQ
jgi:hypothetical protein